MPFQTKLYIKYYKNKKIITALIIILIFSIILTSYIKYPGKTNTVNNNDIIELDLKEGIQLLTQKLMERNKKDLESKIVPYWFTISLIVKPLETNDRREVMYDVIFEVNGRRDYAYASHVDVFMYGLIDAVKEWEFVSKEMNITLDIGHAYYDKHTDKIVVKAYIPVFTMCTIGLPCGQFFLNATFILDKDKYMVVQYMEMNLRELVEQKYLEIYCEAPPDNLTFNPDECKSNKARFINPPMVITWPWAYLGIGIANERLLWLLRSGNPPPVIIASLTIITENKTIINEYLEKLRPYGFNLIIENNYNYSSIKTFEEAEEAMNASRIIGKKVLNKIINIIKNNYKNINITIEYSSNGFYIIKWNNSTAELSWDGSWGEFYNINEKFVKNLIGRILTIIKDSLSESKINLNIVVVVLEVTTNAEDNILIKRTATI